MADYVLRIAGEGRNIAISGQGPGAGFIQCYGNIPCFSCFIDSSDIGGIYQMDFQRRNTIYDKCAFQGLIVQHTVAAVVALLAPAPGRDDQQRVINLTGAAWRFAN